MRTGTILMLLMALAWAGCSDDETQAVEVEFAAVVGSETFVCGQTYELGSENTPLDLVDYRFYVQSMELRDSNGIWNPVALDDNDFQSADTALLDFEDGCGEMGNAETNFIVAGSVPAGEYDAIRFDIGVPFEMNHEDPTSMPSPMNLTSLHWNWQGGYKFIRLDSGSFSGGGWRLHLGSTGCDGDPVSGGTTECANPNRVRVELDNFDPTANAIATDIAALVAGQDLGNLQPMPPGCMSGPGDADCVTIFSNMGLAYDGVPPAGAQSFVRVQ